MAAKTVANALASRENNAKPPSKSRFYDCFQQNRRASIFLGLFVVALSAGVSYLLGEHQPLFLQRGLIRLDPYFSNWGRHGSAPPPRNEVFKHSLLWMAPFFSGGGYCSEAISYATALEETGTISKLAIRHHGDAESLSFWKGLGFQVRQTLSTLSSIDLDFRDAVVVCHSEPGAWHPPLYMTNPCPPNGYKEPLYVIGRTMFETDGVTAHHVLRCNRMDEVWVPSQFHVDTFTRAGVVADKLVKVVQPVDTRFFNPARVRPLRLPTATPLFGSSTNPSPSPLPFVFLSIFKWEHRKGWDLLLSAYLSSFSAADTVSLYLLTNPYHSSRDFATTIAEFVSNRSIQEPPSGWPRVFLLDHHVPQSQLPSLYRAADCFVLPSRGEGWGRPHVEAMAMELPVIATNWSGTTEYMTEGNSYPLRVERMAEVEEGPFQGQLWAEPCVRHLGELMRYVAGHREEGKVKGKRAREDMVREYAPEVVARVVVEQLVRIQGKVEFKRRLDSKL